MFSQISEIPDTLLHNSLTNIDIYKKFIIDNEIVDFYKLYQICNYLEDIYLGNVAELIINMVKEKDLEIDQVFKYMEIMSTNLYDKFITLLFISFKKYDKSEFYNKILEYKNTTLHDLIFKNIFLMMHESISQYN